MHKTIYIFFAGTLRISPSLKINPIESLVLVTVTIIAKKRRLKKIIRNISEEHFFVVFIWHDG